MTLPEFKDEFNFKYDAASKGAPDIDNYEMSLMLTQAVRDITEMAVATFEANEESRRLVAPILKYHDSTVALIRTNPSGIKEYTVSLPGKLMSVLREEPGIENSFGTVEIVVCSIDHANTILNNPFKKPNARKVLKIEKDSNFFTIYSKNKLLTYKLTYVAEIEPIIIDDLDYEMTIEGKDSKNETNLPAFCHHKIVDVAVSKASEAVRTSGLKSK